MSGPHRRSGPAAGILNGLIISAGTYGLLVGVALAGGLTALLVCLVSLLALLHGCLTGTARGAITSTSLPLVPERSAPAFSLTSGDE